MRQILFLLLTMEALAACWGCSDSRNWEAEYSRLLQRSMDLEHRHCQLQASTDSLWDVTSRQLDKALPAAFPAIDRGIFLKARNADHIRMFMSFKQLNPQTQTMVNQAGQYDTALAAQLQTVLQQSQALEQEKIAFLRKVAQHDLAASQDYGQKLRSASTAGCQ